MSALATVLFVIIVLGALAASWDTFMANVATLAPLIFGLVVTLLLIDWMGSAQFDRPEDHWPRHWAEAYLDFAAREMRGWLHDLGMRWFPVVG